MSLMQSRLNPNEVIFQRGLSQRRRWGNGVAVATLRRRPGVAWFPQPYSAAGLRRPKAGSGGAIACQDGTLDAGRSRPTVTSRAGPTRPSPWDQSQHWLDRERNLNNMNNPINVNFPSYYRAKLSRLFLSKLIDSLLPAEDEPIACCWYAAV